MNIDPTLVELRADVMNIDPTLVELTADVGGISGGFRLKRTPPSFTKKQSVKEVLHVVPL